MTSENLPADIPPAHGGREPFSLVTASLTVALAVLVVGFVLGVVWVLTNLLG